MKIYNGIGEIDERLSRPVLTVGNFDGVHIGHGRVIGLVVERARKIEGTSVVMTFDPHSRVFFNPDSHEPMITTLEQRLELIESLGPEAVIIQRFDEGFASMEAEDFIVRLLVERLGIAEIFVSAKFTFGHGAIGNVELLERAAGEHGFKLNVVENVHFRHSLVSSSFIRRAVLNGEMELAMRMLGRPSPFNRSFGTTKSEIPLVPGGAPGSRASTRWMMFSARSCSPKVMKVFWPKRR